MDRNAAIIRSRSNLHLRRFRALGEQEDEGLALIEGWKLLEEALAAGAVIEEAALSAAVTPTERGRSALEELSKRGVPVRLVEGSVFPSLSAAETSQGVLALARRPSFDEEQFYRAVPLVVVAVGIQNPGNLGGLMRTAEAAGSTGAYLTEATADPFSWKALRGSMGSAFRLPHLRRQGVDSVLARVKKRGLKTLVSVAEGGTAYDEVDLRGGVALFFGNEGSGLPPHLLEGACTRVCIPMHGPVESLNVGVAAGILLFEAARQRGGGDRGGG
jgi:TrmH family RNA methyltransferase